MKALIRPTLLTLARLGLFLAAVAWVVGQWWTIELFVDLPGKQQLWTVVAPEGIVQSRLNFKGSGPVTLQIESAGNEPTSQWFEPYDTNWGSQPRYVFQGGGFVYATNYEYFLTSFRHWLIVTVLALFYGVLKWVYRRQPAGAQQA